MGRDCRELRPDFIFQIGLRYKIKTMPLRYDFEMEVPAFSKIGALTGIFDGAFSVKRISRRFAGIIREKMN